ncbi:unnamed protein product (macronuclear) [Paramecium tetraurelia]|uniref:Uncharacterized protein n=1 Tax=Paramecium tetraurelia TaxID=5888 RepID=A0CGC7_PARTE|nr:uncharacterized protein GSPATT00007284001 [Paramecium tetraurelia]CAK69844.1 unnamed protein product [Paramecium tetraurelia]|eukprot:XP_001437241.1 hypothetical protein (macronuclear) [Paramecium tetraurelia strain d4-2]
MERKKCPIHNESVIFQRPNQSDPNQRNLCKNCIVQMDNNLILIEDRQLELKRQQTEMQEEKELEYQNSMSILEEIKQDLFSFENQFKTSFNKYIETIDQYGGLFQTQMAKFSHTIKKLSLADSQLFSKSCKQLASDTPNLSEIKKNLQTQLSILDSKEFFNKLQEKINKLSQDQNIVPPKLAQSNLVKQNIIDLQCKIHKSSIVMADLNEKSTIQSRLVCLSCVEQHQIKFTRIERVLELKSIYYSNLVKSFDMKIEQTIQQQEAKNKSLEDFENKISQLIQQHKREQNQKFNIQIDNIRQKKKTTQEIWSADNLQGMSTIVNILSQPNYIEQVDDKLKEDLQSLEEIQKKNFDCLIINCQDILKRLKSGDQLLEQELINTNERKAEVSKRETQQIITNQEQKKVVKYQLLQQCSIKQCETCYALSINKDSSLVIAACRKRIQIFQLNYGQLIPIQTIINQHSGDVYCLTFFKKSNNFISGSQDQSIKIWERKKTNYWACVQNLDFHQSSIFCLIYSRKEDLIISGSADNTIKIWALEKLWMCKQTIRDHTNIVYGLCLNEQSNILVSSGRDNKILVFKLQNDTWNLCQTIMNEQFGIRVCFINNSAFCFQPRNFNKLYIYDMNNGQYTKTKEVSVQNGEDCDSLFPQQFIKQKQLLVNKNGSSLNFLSMHPNSELTLDFSIEFHSKKLFGTLSNDGEYLITWDDKQKEIQVRKYNL